MTRGLYHFSCPYVPTQRKNIWDKVRSPSFDEQAYVIILRSYPGRIIIFWIYTRWHIRLCRFAPIHEIENIHIDLLFNSTFGRISPTTSTKTIFVNVVCIYWMCRLSRYKLWAALFKMLWRCIVGFIIYISNDCRLPGRPKMVKTR